MSQTGRLLSEADRQLVESHVYDQLLQPRYNALRAHLFWDDELPSGITTEGLDVLTRLWIARSFLYHGFQLPDLFDPTYFKNIWEQALSENLNWPGFNRLTLNAENQILYEQMLNQEDPFG